MNTTDAPTLADLTPKLDRFFELTGPKILDLDKTWNPADGTPVFTVRGKYTTRGWTEWTQGFQYGCAIYQYDATDDPQFLDLARKRTVDHMAPHVSHIGVHDHGFNNVSTYGNLRRLAREGRFEASQWEINFYELALKVSGAVQAARWTPVADQNLGYVHSFNGPHSLFSDTIRSMRSLVLADQLGHVLMGENDKPINLLDRSIQHALTTAKYNVYYGEGRDAYDTPDQLGRVVHESIFNTADGNHRCPSTQQGYAPFTTWTRGLAWILCGFAEQLEYLDAIQPTPTLPALSQVEGSQVEGSQASGIDEITNIYRRAAEATASWYITHSFTDGMVYWDSGAPNIPRDLDYDAGPSDPYNDHEPIDSSAAAIAAQGFWRLGQYTGNEDYLNAALRIADTLFDEPYLSTDPSHQGLILHSIYHQPRGWDYIPPDQQIPCGESSLWGDYHAIELATMLHREANNKPYITFFDRPE